MCSQIATLNNEGEEESFQDFNFNEWIKNNELESIKELLIKHKAITPSTLSMASPQFQSFMSDPQLFTKSHMIPKIMSAVSSISITSSTPSPIRVIVSEQEQTVIDIIQNNLTSFKETDKKLNKLKEELPKSTQRIENIRAKKMELAQVKIDKIFKDLSAALNKRKEAILNEISISKNYSDIQKDDDEKEIDIIASCTENIENSRKFLKDREKTYNELTSNNDNRSERKARIINIGKEVQTEFAKTQNVLNNNFSIIDKRITDNNSMIVDIDYNLNENEYKRMINNIGKLGIVINRTYHSSLKQNEVEEVEDDEVIIKRLKQELEQKTDEYKDLKKVISQKESNERKELEKLKGSITFSNDCKCRWFKQEDDEKKENIFQCVEILKDNPICIKLGDATYKNKVSQNSLLLVPPLANIQDIAKYNEQLLKNTELLLTKYITKIQVGDTWLDTNKSNAFTISGNALKHTGTTTGWHNAYLSNVVEVGKHHWKFELSKMGINCWIGIWDDNQALVTRKYIPYTKDCAYAFLTDAALNKHGSGGTIDGYGVRCKDGDILDMYVDCDKNALSFSINNQDFGKSHTIKKTKYRATVCSGGSNEIELLIYEKLL